MRFTLQTLQAKVSLTLLLIDTVADWLEHS